MAKIENDKYYTPVDLAKYCIDKTFEIIGKENITDIIEPSAGNGSFSNQLDCTAYDLYPEGNNIIKQDYLKLDLPYKEGRLIIGNPPYGTANNLSVQFYKQAIKQGDYISFILPISQFNNTQKMYEFDLVYSEDLGERLYSNKKVRCCLNIFKRNENGLNKKPDYKLKEVIIKSGERHNDEKRNKIITKDIFNYDIGICAWGVSCGKVLEEEGKYCYEHFIKINNDKYKDEVINLIKNAKWNEIYPMLLRSKIINKWQIYKYIKEQIPEIE